MGTLISNGVVLGRNASGNSFVLLRPKERGEKNLWRQKFIEESRREINMEGHSVSVFDSIDIPAFLHPVRASIVPFNSYSRANKQIALHWDSEHGTRFRHDLADFKGFLASIYAAEQRMIRFGVFGLYTHEQPPASGEAKPKLHSVFTLLPGSHESTASIIPVVVSSLKAPWNAFSGRRMSHEQWKKQHWGIDLAALIFAVQTYFRGNPASFPEEVIAAWRIKLTMPSSQPSMEFRGKKKSGTDTSHLEFDLKAFGFAIEDMDVTPHVFKNEIVYDLGLTAEQARNISDEYHQWAERMVGSEIDRN